MEREIVVGIDIGTTKIAVFIGSKDEQGKPVILGMGKSESIGVDRGIVRNIEQTSISIKKAIEEVEQKTGYTVREVFVGIAGHQIRNIQHRGNIMLEAKNHIIREADKERLIKDQENLVLQPGERIIHVVPQSFIVDGDGDIINPIGMPGSCLEGNFNIITGNVNNIENIIRSVEMANCKVRNLILEPIASAEAVVNASEKEAGVCLVDIGGGTTDIAIFHDGILRHTAVIPLAGNAITDDIKEGCSIIKTQAEALKTRFGSCLAASAKEDEIIAIPGFRGRDPREISMKTLAGIIQARMEMIIDQVLFEIKTKKYEKKLIAGIVLSGGGAKMKDCVQLTEFITGIDARVGTPQDHLGGTITEEITHPMHATGIGLILEGLKKLEKENSLNRTPMASKQNENIEEEEPEELIEEEVEDEKEQNDKKKSSEGKTKSFIVSWLEGLFKDEGPE
ncbi:MAG: cell division protein FtsA [Bacteroidales bacterium]|jgi:cell division protein FtsA|nr:cell division protein FtsA [Bacteroidales bacterium]MDD4703534.1 cell division protein FtsA [Bacteroidales bacterium]MDX9798301.1 cell division protein FtsA [Bacteroidales bacterium]